MSASTSTFNFPPLPFAEPEPVVDPASAPKHHSIATTFAILARRTAKRIAEVARAAGEAVAKAGRKAGDAATPLFDWMERRGGAATAALKTRYEALREMYRRKARDREKAKGKAERAARRAERRAAEDAARAAVMGDPENEITWEELAEDRAGGAGRAADVTTGSADGSADLSVDPAVATAAERYARARRRLDRVRRSAKARCFEPTFLRRLDNASRSLAGVLARLGAGIKVEVGGWRCWVDEDAELFVVRG